MYFLTLQATTTTTGREPIGDEGERDVRIARLFPEAGRVSVEQEGCSYVEQACEALEVAT